MIWPETAKCVSFKMLLKTNFNSIISFKLIITKLQLVLVLDFFFSWPKTAIVDVYNTCNGNTDIIRHARNSQYKNL